MEGEEEEEGKPPGELVGDGEEDTDDAEEDEEVKLGRMTSLSRDGTRLSLV